jgi:hypothetical protein
MSCSAAVGFIRSAIEDCSSHAEVTCNVTIDKGSLAK